MSMTPHEFVAKMLELDIVAAATIEEFLGNLSMAKRDDLRELLRALVRSGLVTRFQASRILQQRSDELVLGNYLLCDPIGKGGMGVVYKARHRWMDRIVALKVLNDKAGEEYALRRFQREVQAAAKLIHPNIVTAFDADEFEGRMYLVMEYVPGEDLVTLVQDSGPFPLAKAVSCVLQAARGLYYAHQQGVVHRDIKPSNMLLDEEGSLKILDMGLARIEGAPTSLAQPPDPNDNSLTRVYQILGTVDFMSPEQADESHQADERSDIYSLGCTLYYLLTGKPPYSRLTLIKTLMAHRVDPIPSLLKENPSLPEELQIVFEKMIAKDPAGRFNSMAEVVKALTPFDDDTDFHLSESLAMLADDGEDTKVFDFDDDELENAEIPNGLSGLDEFPPAESTADDELTQSSTDDTTVSTNDTTGPASTIPIGIDLGTTYSVLSYVDRTGQPQTIPNSEGELLTPSAIYLSPKRDILVGRDAIEALSNDPKHVAEHAKREVGTVGFFKQIYGQSFPPEVLLALVLQKIRKDAEARLGPISEAVITVPAYFDETRRLATQNAGFMAGLRVLDIINEPTAAALSFGIERFSNDVNFQPLEDGQSLLIYDLGGGTFDVTVLSYNEGVFRTLSTDGDVELGGLDWDQRIVDHVAERVLSATKTDPRSDAQVLSRLRLDCERAKRALTTRNSATIRCSIQGRDYGIELTRDDFERLTADLLMRTEFTVQQVVKSSKLTWSEIDRVLLVGGSTRMPAVANMLKRISGRPPELAPFPDEVVSHGAALHAESLLARKQGQPVRVRIRNVNSHSLGVSAMNRKTGKQETSILIPRNTPLPAIAKRLYRTRQKGQKQLVIPILEGESSDPRACSQLGRCLVQELPPDLPAGSPVEVSFSYRQNGRLSLSVSVAGKSWIQKLQRYTGLRTRDLIRWKKRVEIGDLFEAEELGFAELDDDA